jgi:hypothetical protein
LKSSGHDLSSEATRSHAQAAVGEWAPPPEAPARKESHSHASCTNVPNDPIATVLEDALRGYLGGLSTGTLRRLLQDALRLLESRPESEA